MASSGMKLMYWVRSNIVQILNQTIYKIHQKMNLISKHFYLRKTSLKSRGMMKKLYLNLFRRATTRSWDDIWFNPPQTLISPKLLRRIMASRPYSLPQIKIHFKLVKYSSIFYCKLTIKLNSRDIGMEAVEKLIHRGSKLKNSKKVLPIGLILRRLGRKDLRRFTSHLFMATSN